MDSIKREPYFIRTSKVADNKSSPTNTLRSLIYMLLSAKSKDISTFSIPKLILPISINCLRRKVSLPICTNAHLLRANEQPAILNFPEECS